MEPNQVEKSLGTYLVEHGYFIATAESCTGGLIAHRITNIARSSNYFLGGMIVYSNQVKMHWLGVKAETLNSYGPVSRQAVEEMASGLAKNLQYVCPPSKLLTIAISGIAGPSGATAERPVGRVWMAWSFNTLVRTSVFQFYGDRLAIKQQSADEALFGAWLWLLELNR